MGDFEEALASAETATELHFTYGRDGYLDGRIAQFANLEELQLRDVPPECELPEELLALPKLRRLGLAGENDKLVVPALVGKLNLDELTVWDAHASELPPLPRLRSLSMVVRDPRTEVAILAERFGHLVGLAIRGQDLARGELPVDIERFSRLESLTLSACGVSTLPAALANLHALRRFEIRGCPLTTFPDVLTRMPELASVTIACEIGGLPSTLPAMTGLRELVLARALNKGAMLSRWDDLETMKALPKVLGECTGLEKLVLDHCGVFDARPLRSLTNLRSLSLAWSALTTVEPLAALTELEELSLESCDRLRDLSPLAKLAKLRVLDLDNTRPRSLDFVRALPELRELHIEGCECKRIDAIYDRELDLHADDEVEERYAARAELRNLPSIASIVEALGARDLAVVERACADLATWAAASSTRGANALAAALGLRTAEDSDDDDLDDDDDDDEEDDLDDDDDDDDDDLEDDDDDDGVVRAGGSLPALERALDRFLARLSPTVLARLFGALFSETSDNFPAALRIANELVSRSDDAAQCILVDGFIAANEYYDAGHREHGYTVHDELIEHVFPLLGGPALAKLLAWCSDDHLDADGMEPLFVPAIARTAGPDREAVLARLGSYLASLAKYRGGGERVAAVWAALGDAAHAPDVEAVRDRLAARVAAQQRLEELGKQLADAGRAPAAIAEASALPDEQLGELQQYLWSTNDLPALPSAARRELLRLWQRLDHEPGTVDALQAFARTVARDELRADLDVLAATGAARGAVVRAAVLRGLARDCPVDAIESLRTLAGELDGLSPTQGASGEVQALLYGGAEHFEVEQVKRGLAALSSLATYDPPDRARDKPSALATMVAHLAECSDFEPLQALARDLHKLALTGKSLERVLAQLVAVCLVSGDREGVDAILPLVPTEITWDILAFNLACKYARENDREPTLRFTQRALELGKSPDQFLADTDFESFVSDREFVAILDAHR